MLILVISSNGDLVIIIIMLTGDIPEPILKCLIHLLMPLAVPNHLLLLGKVLPLAHRHRAVEVLSININPTSDRKTGR
jgi:hypothetical protein